MRPPYRILNHLGCEVDRLDADSSEEALAKYANKLDVPVSKLIQMGYAAIVLNLKL